MKRFHLHSSLAVILALATILPVQSAAHAAITATPKGQKKAPIIVTHRLLLTIPIKGKGNPNPNHLPNLAPAVGGGLAECGYYPPQTCQQACGSIIVTTYIGVKNTTAYPISGTIEVLLQAIPGNTTVRRWTVNGLAGTGETYTGKIRTPFYCPPPGTEAIHDPNFVLIVKAPPGVTELDPNDNRAEMYLRPTSTISQ
jgi:hypothetical protein